MKMNAWTREVFAGFSLAAVFLLIAASAASAGNSPDAVAALLRQEALTNTGAMEIVGSLTTDIGQRLHGTESEKRAAEWAAARFQKTGFDSVTIEEFPLTNGWVRGAETARLVGPFSQNLFVTALGESVATPPEGIEAEAAVFRTYADLLAAPAGSLSNKIAVVTQRMPRNQDGSGYGALSKIRSRGPSEAAKRGAVAFLLRSLSTDDNRFPHTGVMHYEAGIPKIPAGALAAPDAGLLERIADDAGKILIHLTLTPTNLGPVMSRNVIAELKGREKPDEVVLLGAHLDSWDLGTGALDDGTGVGIVMEAGRLISQLPLHPKRTLRVVLYGSEEVGLLGGAAYARMHSNELQHIIIAAEPDLGQGPIYKLQTGVKNPADPTISQIMRALTPLGIIQGDNLSHGSSDIEPLFEGGVPAVTLDMDATDYFDYHHTANDTMDKVKPERLNQSVAAFTVFAYLATELDGDYRPAPVMEKKK